MTARQPQSVNLTTEGLAERLHKSPHAVRCMQSRGDAPASFRVGKRRLYPLAAVEAWEAACMKAAQAARTAA